MQHIPEAAAEHSAESALIVSFRLGSQQYSLPVAAVCEVVRLPALVTLVGAAPALCGLLNLRGLYLPVFDGRLLIGEEAGYDLSKLEERVAWRLELTKQRPPIASLAATMALEHFTAILAHQLLADPVHLAGADPEAAELWRWHACEEIEHKGVAYDTWLHATRHWPRFKRWKVKAKVMLFVTRNFVVDRTMGALELLRQDGITGLRAWLPLLWYLWGRPGMMRRIAGAWASFFMPGFHPWNEDDRHLVRAYENSAAAIPAPQKQVRRARAA